MKKKALDDFRHLYRVTDDFRIENIGIGSGRTKGRPVNIFLRRKNGYPSVELSNLGFKRKVFLHRIIAEEFVPNPNNLPQVNHKDGDRWNYHPSNLEWVTGSENILHAIHNGWIKYDKMKKPVLDLSTGIFYDSMVDACDAKLLTPERVRTKIWRNKNDTNLVYV